MPRGISLHVGVNKPSSAFSGAATLQGPENDALAMEKIASDNKFDQHDVLLGCDATYARVTTKIRSAATQLKAGDIFFFTFAGHGFQVVDRGRDRDEADRLDETMLLFDVELIDDVLRKSLWPCFDVGVRILMVADCCHSETLFQILAEPSVFKVAPFVPSDTEFAAIERGEELPILTPDGLLARMVSRATGERHQAEYGEFYRNLLLPQAPPSINASILALGACKDNQTTGDGPNGIYTAAMLEVLKSNPINYDELVKGIADKLKHDGHPSIPTIRDDIGITDPGFRAQRPFTI